MLKDAPRISPALMPRAASAAAKTPTGHAAGEPPPEDMGRQRVRVWLRDGAFLVSFLAALVVFACGWNAGRSLLRSVYHAWIAMTGVLALGLSLSHVVSSQFAGVQLPADDAASTNASGRRP